MYTYIPSLLSLPPIHLIQPSRSSQSTRVSICATQPLPTIDFTHGSVYMSVLLSQFLPPFLPYCVQKSVLYVCVSIPTLKIHSSVPFFYSPYICINIIFYSFRLTSFYMINTRFIPITTNDPDSFLSVAEQCVR